MIHRSFTKSNDILVRFIHKEDSIATERLLCLGDTRKW